MKVDEQYKILAFDALAFARRLKSEDVSKFLQFVERNCSADELVVIRALVQAAASKKPLMRQLVVKRGAAEQDVYTREIRAILSDTEFLPSRRDLILLINAVVGDIPDGLVKKGSRDSIVDWAVKAVAGAADSDRQSKYRSIRQIFLRKRDSSLKDWADILSKPGQ